MSNITEAIQSLPYFYPDTGASAESIINAEKRLGVTFSEDYREYVKAFGDASANGHELTGVTDEDRIDVVSVTLAERKRNSTIPLEMYVVEQTHVDRIVIWQDTRGLIYQTIPGDKPKMISRSLIEYVAT